MALIKLSSIGITNISGKAGGSVYAHNRGGSYVRNFAVPSNPQSEAQMSVRSLFGALSSSWRTLSVETQKAWSAAAESFPVKNPFGDQRILSGMALYQMLNRNLSVIGEDALIEPPVPQGTQALQSLAFDATQTAAGDAAALNILGTIAPGTVVTTKFAIYATPPLSAGVSSASNRLRLITVSAAASVTAGIDLASDYVAIFGQPPVGSGIIVRATPINTETGERGGSSETRSIVTEVVVP